MDFTPEVEDEVIRDAVSYKLYIPIVNQSIKFCRDSAQAKTPPSSFHIGDFLRYINEGNNKMVYWMDSTFTLSYWLLSKMHN